MGNLCCSKYSDFDRGITNPADLRIKRAAAGTTDDDYRVLIEKSYSETYSEKMGLVSEYG